MTISIICPVFNTSPTYLRQSVESVLIDASDYEVEILLIDDCSTSLDTVETLAQLAIGDPRIRVIRCSTNGGPGLARHLGLKHARFPWIGFIDSDDIWEDHALSRFMAISRCFPAEKWIGADYSILTGSGQKVRRETSSYSYDSKQFADITTLPGTHRLNGEEFTKWLISDNRFHLGAHIYKIDLLREISAFSDGNRFGEDWLFFVFMSLRAPCVFTTDAFYILRRQQVSMMTSKECLSQRRVEAQYNAFRDSRLKRFRSPVRWALYARLKTLALDFALEGSVSRAIITAFRAYSLDPREVGDIFLFFFVIVSRRQEQRLAFGRKYTKGELLRDRRSLFSGKSG